MADASIERGVDFEVAGEVRVGLEGGGSLADCGEFTREIEVVLADDVLAGEGDGGVDDASGGGGGASVDFGFGLHEVDEMAFVGLGFLHDLETFFAGTKVPEIGVHIIEKSIMVEFYYQKSAVFDLRGVLLANLLL